MSAERDKNYPRIEKMIEISLDSVVRCIYIGDIRIPGNRICIFCIAIALAIDQR